MLTTRGGVLYILVYLEPSELLGAVGEIIITIILITIPCKPLRFALCDNYDRLFNSNSEKANIQETFCHR